MRVMIAFIVTASLFLGCLDSAYAKEPEPWTNADTHAALVDAPYVVECIVQHESQYYPYSIGSKGELGVAQLLPTEDGGGQMEEFLNGDWSDMWKKKRSPFDPYLSVRYLIHWGETHGWTFYPWISTWSLC